MKSENKKERIQKTELWSISTLLTVSCLQYSCMLYGAVVNY